MFLSEPPAAKSTEGPLASNFDPLDPFAAMAGV